MKISGFQWIFANFWIFWASPPIELAPETFIYNSVLQNTELGRSGHVSQKKVIFESVWMKN